MGATWNILKREGILCSESSAILIQSLKSLITVCRVIEAHANYISTAGYDDIVTVKAFLRTMPGVRVKIEYELYVAEKLIVTGYTVHSFINLATMKPVRPPKDFVDITSPKFK